MLRKMPNHQLLVIVIKHNLSLDFLPQSAKAIGVNPVSLTTVRKRCELMCKCLLEKILQVEEANNNEVVLLTVPYVLVLHVFCLVDPTLCAPASNPSQFVVTLQPYLKSQQVERSLFCLGLLIRYGSRLLSSSSNKTIDVQKSLGLFTRYLSMEDFIIKVQSLQALGFVLIARPEYMLEKDIGKILEGTLSSAVDTRLKMLRAKWKLIRPEIMCLIHQLELGKVFQLLLVLVLVLVLVIQTYVGV